MKEHKREQLRAAIEQLPQYQADETIWARIDQSLDADQQAREQEMNQQMATALLPKYEAPASVWQRIEKAMDQAKVHPWRYAGRIAAVLLLLLAIGGLAVWQWPDGKGVSDPVSEQTNLQPPLDLPVAEELSLSVLRERESGLLACLEARADWEGIRRGKSMQRLLVIMAQDRATDSTRVLLQQEQQLLDSLRQAYACPE